jgi:4-amino-4-deoxy-L-arabinose transferase-like glycosyltransferase
VTSKVLRSNIGPYLLLALIAIGTLFFRLGVLPFIGADECRYARIAEETSQAGRWVTPLLQGYPWLEKPPLYYWMTMPFFRIFGVSEATARLGPVLCALLAVAAALWLGTKLWSRQAGLLAAVILLTTIGFCAYGRSASTDMPITACFTIAFALLAVAAVKGGMAFWKVASAYVMLGLAVLAKGPVAFALAAGIVLIFWTLDEQGGSLKRMHVWSGSAIAIAVAFPWFWLAFKENGFSFISTFFINQNFARYISDVHHHEQPFYYFLPVLLGLFFPWSGWLPALVPASMRAKVLDWRAWNRGTVFLTCWAAFPLLFFSLSTSKLPGYILPSLPPLALLLSRGLTEWIQGGDCTRGPRVARWFHLILSLGVAAAFPIVMYTSYGKAWRPGLCLALAVALPAFFAFWLARRGRLRRAIQTTAVQGLVLVLAATQFAFPALAAYNSAREIARQALVADADAEPIITFCFFHHALLYYTGYRIGENIVDPAAVLDLARKQTRVLVVTQSDRISDLERIPGLSVTMLGEQGKLRLVRITRISQNPEVRSQKPV